MKKTNQPLALLLALALACSLAAPASALAGARLQSAADRAAAYMLGAVTDPQVGSIGGEWAVLGLARGGYKAPENYYADYFAAVETHTAACKGVLSGKKYTEYSRVVLALTAIGKDPANVAGYDLLAPLGDFKAVMKQGLTGPVWALIALDAGAYAVPRSPGAELQATRQLYIDEILSRRLSDGGWNQSGAAPSDPDATAMALHALAKYQEQAAVKAAITEALGFLSAAQEADGGYSSYGVSCCESVAQVVVALCELGIAVDDARFVKNGVTLLDKLLRFQLDGGGFCHTAGGGVDQMASEQGLYALSAALRVSKGESSFYRMGISAAIPPVSAPGKTFADIAACENRAAIEALAERGLIGGMGSGLFAPEDFLTRAQFAAIVTRALGFAPKAAEGFKDVPKEAWYAGYVGAAYAHGLVEGRADGIFDPEGLITRQEAAVLIARAARLCGMDTAVTDAGVHAALAGLADGGAVAGWAAEGTAFCLSEGIFGADGKSFAPQRAILRRETAQALFDLLTKAGLM